MKIKRDKDSREGKKKHTYEWKRQVGKFKVRRGHKAIQGKIKRRKIEREKVKE